MADDGYVLEWRNSDAGANMFAGNADAKTHAPKFMWDEKKVGYKSITVDQLHKGDHFLVKEKNAVPFDTQSPMVTSGIRIGTPAVTTRGLREGDMKTLASWIDRTIRNIDDEAALAAIRAEVLELCSSHPLYADF